MSSKGPGNKEEAGGDIVSKYQAWKTEQFEEEDKELMEAIKVQCYDICFVLNTFIITHELQEIVMSDRELTMFQQLQVSNILLWGVEKVKHECIASWQNQVGFLCLT